jgi:TetR/AcrR family transcriptional regulator, cholesterol catabolism regulator
LKETGAKAMTDFDTIAEQVSAMKQAYCLELFASKRKPFQIKKEKTIAKNLETIFNAALSISNRQSFHAMSMRDLSREAGLSIGALYNYFSGKEALLTMMQQQRRTITRRLLMAAITKAPTPSEQLRTAIRTHLYLSEIMQPWFYFSYMEAKNLEPAERQAAVRGELNTEQLFVDILEAGVDQRVFNTVDCRMTAALIKAMLQDWYLKRAKYARRRISVDQYCQFLTTFLEKNLIPEESHALS